MTLNIVIALAACFVVQSILLEYSSLGQMVPSGEGITVRLFHYFGLSPNTLAGGWVWQLATFNFLHAPFGAGGFFHILFNCWAIWVFGHAVEEATGPKRLFAIFLATGIAGGLLEAIGALILPRHFGANVVGASAGVFGLIGAYAALFPTRQITMLLFFVLPVTITAKFLLIFSGLVALFGIVIPTGNVAHGAHLGGLLAGLAFIRILQSDWTMPRPRFTLFSRPKVFVHSRPPSGWTATKPSKPAKPSKAAQAEVPSEEFISQEVDPILDKISAHGIQSLTERERKILEAARARMARR